MANEDLRKTLLENKAGAVADPEPVKETSQRPPSQGKLKKGRELDSIIAEFSEEKRARRATITFHCAEEIDEKLRIIAQKAGVSKSKVIEKLLITAMSQ